MRFQIAAQSMVDPMPVILTVPDFNAAAREISLRFKRNPPKAPLIRIEGFCGSGKTSIARRLVSLIGGHHIEGDQFASKHNDPPPYPDCIRRNELDDAIEHALETESPLILDAVCLAEVAPVERWGRGLVVYVKQLSFNNPHDPLWHDGLSLEGDPPDDQPHRSVHIYHLKMRPHEIADLIIEVPHELHRLPSEPFSREGCFDPPNSTVSSLES